MSEAIVDQKYLKLQDVLRSFRRVAVAFSAGVDSTFLLKAAADTLGPANVIAVTGTSDSLAQAEFKESIDLAKALGVEHVLIETEEFKDPNYLANPTNRCYFCKSELFNKLDGFIAARGLDAVLAGVNTDDYADWRPGIQAGKERDVRAPLAEVGMTKDEIRVLSERFGLPTYDKPASPCLSSRIQYGEEITPEKLRRIEQGEKLLRSLGFRECRVRHHHNLARIEVPADEIERLCQPETRRQIDAAFREFGYTFVCVDLRGFRSGSLNEVIAFGKRQTGD